MTMYSVSFMWTPGEYDAEFHRLNAEIDAVAKSLPGFCGSESWRSADGMRGNAVYYWNNLDDLAKFASHPTHLEAKRQYARWYAGYHVVVAQVLRSYGDGQMPHVTREDPYAPA